MDNRKYVMTWCADFKECNMVHFVAIGACYGHKYLYPAIVAPRIQLSYLGSLMAWMCRDGSYAVKAFIDGRLVMRKALDFSVRL